MKYSYWIENDELVVADNTSGKILWNGKIYDKSVLKVLAVPASNDCIALLSYKPYNGGNKYGDPPNLVRCRWDGTIIWHAKTPDPVHTQQDFFLNIYWKDEKLWGQSSSSFNVEIDIESGDILSQKFVP